MEDKNGSKGSVVMEETNVSEEDIIFYLLRKHKNKLGKDAVNSFLYTLNECVKHEKGEIAEDISESRKSIRK